MICGCGRSAGHEGTCSWIRTSSPAEALALGEAFAKAHPGAVITGGDGIHGTVIGWGIGRLVLTRAVGGWPYDVKHLRQATQLKGGLYNAGDRFWWVRADNAKVITEGADAGAEPGPAPEPEPLLTGAAIASGYYGTSNNDACIESLMAYRNRIYSQRHAREHKAAIRDFEHRLVEQRSASDISGAGALGCGLFHRGRR